MSQSDLGSYLGITRDAISKIELGHSMVTLPSLVKIAAVLDYPLTHFLGVDPPGLSAHEAELLQLLRSIPAQQAQLLTQMVRGLGRPLTVAESKAVYLPETPHPSLEDVMHILEKLDQTELQNVYDYTYWRHNEQNRRRDSSGHRRREEERQQNLDLIDLMLAVDQATPEERAEFARYLRDHFQPSDLEKL